MSQLDRDEFTAVLVARFRNLCPTCELKFASDVPDGVAFRIVDATGAYRSNWIRFYRYSSRALEPDALIRAVRTEGVPHAGLPDGFDW